MLTVVDRGILCAVASILMLGCYQAYFVFQRVLTSKARIWTMWPDRYIGYFPQWVWIYSFFYYAVILAVVFTVRDHRHFVYTAGSYVLLLTVQLLAFTAVNVRTPGEWRHRGAPRSRSEAFLQFVQQVDRPSNCFPSMHTSVAVLTALHLAHNTPSLAPWIATYPLLIALSALFTKQHYLVDTLAAIPAGWICFWAYSFFMAG